MADKSKMTVAEMLAAARKADSKSGEKPASEAPPAAAEASSPAAEPASPPVTTPAKKPVTTPAKKPVAGGGARPSVAEMMAMARGDKAAPTTKAAPAAAEKPAAKAAPKAAPAAKKEAAPPVKTTPADTQSILAAAKSGTKPGPMSKADAAKAAQPAAAVAKAKAKEAIVVPPMPVRPDYAKPAAQRGKDTEKAERRAFLFGLSALTVGFAALAATSAAWTLGTARFMFPNIVRLPPSRFRVGGPDKFAPGQVEEKFKAQFGVWVVNTEYNGEQQIFALKSVCTHLGCTPNWLEAEQKFKCPCHGSGFYKDGINFEGPAPRPLERYAISIASDGQIEIDKSRIYQEEMGQWRDPTCYVPV